MVGAEVDSDQEVLLVNAAHEFMPWEPDWHDTVRMEIAGPGEWLGLG